MDTYTRAKFDMEKVTSIVYRYLLIFRVMLGAFPLIIPNDPVMKMKIEEKAMSLMKKE